MPTTTTKKTQSRKTRSLKKRRKTDRKKSKRAEPTTKKKPSKLKSTKRSKKRANRTAGSCFVLMPFKEPFDTYYSLIIRPAVIAAKLEPLRGDSLFRPSPIMADIWAMIQDAKVLVAELTEKNANVFYELGLSHAIGKPVILMSETIEDVPFDLQPLRVILYDKDDPAWGIRLRNTLIASLEETLSEPTSAVPAMFRKVVKSQAPEESETAQRLNLLEHQIESLRDRSFNTTLTGSRRSITSTTTRLKTRISKVRSRTEAVEATRQAIIGGLPIKYIKDILKRYLGIAESEEVIAEANRLLFSGN